MLIKFLSILLVLSLSLVGCSQNNHVMAPASTAQSTEVVNPDTTSKTLPYLPKDFDKNNIITLPITWDILINDSKYIYATESGEVNRLFQYDIQQSGYTEITIEAERTPHMASLGQKYLVTLDVKSLKGFLAVDENKAMIPLWKVPAPDTEFTALSEIEEDKYVYYGTGYEVAKIDVTTGKKLWVTKLDDYRPMELRYVDDNILQIGENHVIYINRATGKIVKQEKRGESDTTKQLRDNDCSSCILIGDYSDTMYVTLSGKLGIISNGKFDVPDNLNIPLTETNLENPIPTIQGNNIFLYNKNELWTKDLTKNQQWTRYEIPYENIQFKTIVKNMLYVQNKESIYAINLENVEP